MSHRAYRILQGLIVFCLALFLLERIVSGKLYLYINARFAILTVIGMLGLFALAVNVLGILRHNHGSHHPSSDEHEHNHSLVNLLLLALPLALGLLLPIRPLGAELAANRGVTVAGPLISGNSQPALLAAAPDVRNVLDWIRLFNYESDLSPHLGETANVIGFIYPDPRLPDGQFLVARFIVSCCVADAFAIGMAVEWPEDLPADSWVNVRGPVDVLVIDGQRVPLVRAESVAKVAQPNQPYLFP